MKEIEDIPAPLFGTPDVPRPRHTKKWHYISPINKERLEEIPYAEQTISLDEYCDLIYHWILKNKSVCSVMEWYEDDANAPFEYELADVITNDKLRTLIDERIRLYAIRGEVKSQIFNILTGGRIASTQEIEFDLK